MFQLFKFINTCLSVVMFDGIIKLVCFKWSVLQTSCYPSLACSIFLTDHFGNEFVAILFALYEANELRIQEVSA
jgi:hypothetical protein